MKKLKVKDLCEFFWHIETQYDLFNFKADDVYIWQYIRMPLYYQLAEKLSILEKPHKVESNNKIKKIKERLLFGFHALTSVKDLFLLKNNYTTVVVEHDRSVVINNKQRDLYTHSYREKKCAVENVLSLRFPLGTSYVKDDDLNDAIDLSWLLLAGGVISTLYPTKLNDKERLFVSKIEGEIKESLSIKFDLSKYFSKYVRRYRFRSKIISFILRRVNAKHLDIVTPYSGRGDFVGAAKSEGLTTRELQHGIISYYHLGYSFPNDTNLPIDHIFTDELATWGQAWDLGANHHNLLSINSNIVDYPLSENLAKFDIKAKPDSKVITIISQGALTDAISNFIIKNIECFDNYYINYKLHPSEYNVVNDNLKTLDSYANVGIVKKINLYELLYNSKYVIGVFSTALIEAKLIGCEVAILPLAGAEYFENSSGYLDGVELLNELI